MPKKSEIEKIIAGIKKSKSPCLNELITKEIKKGSGIRERDMRQESIDMGVHGAREMWSVNP